MKITSRQLRQIIKEAITTVSDEDFDRVTMPGYKGPPATALKDYSDEVSEEAEEAEIGFDSDADGMVSFAELSNIVSSIRDDIADLDSPELSLLSLKIDNLIQKLSEAKSLSDIENIKNIVIETLEVHLAPTAEDWDDADDEDIDSSDLARILGMDNISLQRSVPKRRSGG